MRAYVETMNERIRRVRLIHYRYLADDKSQYTIESIAKRTGIKPKRIKRIENGGELKGILVEEGKKLSEALGVTLEYILDGKKTIEDEKQDPILFMPQIGSMIHTRRMEIRNQNMKAGSLKEIAQKLSVDDMQINSMDLMRIESLSKSKMGYFKDAIFLNRLSDVLELSMKDIEEALKHSFPHGKEHQATGKEIVISLKEGGKMIKEAITLPADISDDEYERLIERIRFELNLSH